MNEPHFDDTAALSLLNTEGRNPRTMELDTFDAAALLQAMNDEDASIATAVRAALPQIEVAVSLVTERRRVGGRLIYIGAGTSGRIGLLDAVECPPTFGTGPYEVIGVLAGGDSAFVHAVEGAEDSPERARKELAPYEVTSCDVVVGLAASGRTPYVVGGLKYASKCGAATVAVSCNPGAAISAEADVAIEVLTGPEVLTGSTRLKAGTAQKMVCNMISTASMVLTGKAYGNLMVDVQPTNKKLVDRAQRIVADAADVDRARAAWALEQTGGHAKTAVVMLLARSTAQNARELLDSADGRIRDAVRRAALADRGNRDDERGE